MGIREVLSFLSAERYPLSAVLPRPPQV